MNLKKILKGIKKGVEIAAPIAAQFGVPGASTVDAALQGIHDNEHLSNDSAAELMAAQINDMHKQIEELKKAQRAK
jgi:hypothetical protein